MKVKVSEHYNGKGWYDPKSKIKFLKEDGPIEIPEGADMININRYITRNYLVVLDDDTVIEEKKEEQSSLTVGKILKEGNYDDKPKEAKKEEPVETKDEEPTEVEEEEPEVVEEEASEEEQKVNDNGKVECQFCGKEYSPRGIANHEKACKKNPDNK